jgi:putative endopeptidase
MKSAACTALFAVFLATSLLAADKPQYGSWGFDSTGVDLKTKPGDDFFRYANGAWLDRTAIPPDKAAYSLRLAMTDTIESRLHDLMEEAAKRGSGDLEGKVGAFYAACMDASRIESLGITPLVPELNAVRAAAARDDLAGLMGRSTIDFEDTIFGVSTDVDLKDPKRYAVYLS